MFIGLNSGKPIQIYNGHVSFPLKSFKGADQFLLTKTEGAKSKKKKKKKKKIYVWLKFFYKKKICRK